MNYGTNSFSNGEAMNLGGGNSYGVQVPDGSRPPSAWFMQPASPLMRGLR